MARPPQDITDAELGVLEVLWDRGARTIRQLAETLYPEVRAAQYATVQKLLERLEAKGCVARDRSTAVHTFAAVLDRSALIGRRLQSVAEKLCGGSWTPLLTHLVQGQQLNAEQRQELRDLIDRLDEDQQQRR